mgnify:CR=1 FL=1
MTGNKLVSIYLSLGSNLGDRQSNLEAVRSALPPDIVIRECSSIYETEPWGYLDQPDFLNQILLAETKLSARELLAFIKDLEKSIGRVPNFRFGPRLVDIDIIFYGNQIIQEPDLKVPHPRFSKRAFVLVPLVEISPDLIVPGTDQKLSEMLDEVDTSGVHRCQE